MYFLPITLFLALLALRLYIVIIKKSVPRLRIAKNGRPSLGIFLGSGVKPFGLLMRRYADSHIGGHTTEMLKLLSALDKHKYRRVYIVGEGDALSIQKAMDIESQTPTDEVLIRSLYLCCIITYQVY